jgi:hypothetical protein
MNKQQFRRELEYGAAVSIATSMLRRHLITPNEFHKLRAALIKKYRPVIGSLQETDPGDPPATSDLPPKDSYKKDCRRGQTP